MNRYSSRLIFVSGLVLLAGCEKPQVTDTGSVIPVNALSAERPARWYSAAQAERGNALFQAHCASCHKPDASGTPNWRETNAEGKLPPPPLNGTAHTWHHPLSILRRVVRTGGVPLGGSMPGFAAKLNEDQIDDVLAWIQSGWPDEVYRLWSERNAQAGQPMQLIKKG